MNHVFKMIIIIIINQSKREGVEGRAGERERIYIYIYIYIFFFFFFFSLSFFFRSMKTGL